MSACAISGQVLLALSVETAARLSPTSTAAKTVAPKCLLAPREQYALDWNEIARVCHPNCAGLHMATVKIGGTHVHTDLLIILRRTGITASGATASRVATSSVGGSGRGDFTKGHATWRNAFHPLRILLGSELDRPHVSVITGAAAREQSHEKRSKGEGKRRPSDHEGHYSHKSSIRPWANVTLALLGALTAARLAGRARQQLRILPLV